jgi:alpha-L-fucosidase
MALSIAVLMGSCKKQPEIIYEPTWESLSTHPTPAWFRDAKFGIFIHWGVYSVPAFHEWYIEYMSPRSNWGRTPLGPPYNAAQGDFSDSAFRAGIRKGANEFHRDNFGVDFEYDDFIPMFKAEKYDPGAWADLFVRSGARYVVLTAKHGEEFAMWPTKFTERNAMDMGPHRDLAGDLLTEVRAKGLKMGFYHNTTYSFWDKRFPDREWVEYMNNSIKELVDMYQPDILWGDVPISPVFDENGKRKPLNADHWNSREVIAYFYNHSEDPNEVVTNDRWDLDTTPAAISSDKALSKSLWEEDAKRWNAPDGAFLGDFQTPERRNINRIFDIPWETCDALDPTSWGYNRLATDDLYMTTNELVDYLVDIVSKGGNLLINIGPRADGTIPEIMQDRLEGIGEWLSVNGEGIYGSTPWSVYGEGPTTETIGSWARAEADYLFQAGDIRFTRKGDNLYVILLEWPGNQITAGALKGIGIQRLSLLGSGEKVDWKKTEDGITFFLPDQPVSPYASVLKLECEAGTLE